MSFNAVLLPIKAHFFLFNAGIAPLVPYLSTYARQLGFSSSTVGLIYTFLPILGFFAKPFFGYIADRFQLQKNLFVYFEILTLISFGGMMFIREKDLNASIPVEMDCRDSSPIITACYPAETAIDQCMLNRIGNMTSTTCHMKCNMTSSNMWQTACDHWYPTSTPSVCEMRVNSFEYPAYISNVNNSDDCIDITPGDIYLDRGIGGPFNATCVDGYLNELCSLECSDPTLTSLIQENELNMSCINSRLNFQICKNGSRTFNVPESTQQLGKCKVTCLDSMLIALDSCEVKVIDEDGLCSDDRNAIEFIASIAPSQIMVDSNCISIDFEYVLMEDGSVKQPYCSLKSEKIPWSKKFQPQCTIECDNKEVNDILSAATELDEGSQYDKQFWMFVWMMALSWVGQAVVVTFGDAICFDILGSQTSLYGRQRLWGSVGWGVLSLLTGVLIDYMSDGEKKNYKIAFIFMIIFLTCDIIVSCFIQVRSAEVTFNILADVRSMLSSWATTVFLLWTVSVGICTGLLWQFLFWLIEDVAKLNCEGKDHVKTLQGLVSAIQTFGGEIPVMFISGYMLKKFGHHRMMSVVLFGYGIRFILYSTLYNAWWILPIELFQGITSGMFYPTMASYANIVAPRGTETTVQGLVGAIFEGVGSSLGSFIGGQLYGMYGGWLTFRFFGYGALVAGVLHSIAVLIIKKATPPRIPPELELVVRFIRTTEDSSAHIFTDTFEEY